MHDEKIMINNSSYAQPIMVISCDNAVETTISRLSGDQCLST
jgi:hypothetical protein